MYDWFFEMAGFNKRKYQSIFKTNRRFVFVYEVIILAVKFHHFPTVMLYTLPPYKLAFAFKICYCPRSFNCITADNQCINHGFLIKIFDFTDNFSRTSFICR